jgi:hypothetical protein
VAHLGGAVLALAVRSAQRIYCNTHAIVSICTAEIDADHPLTVFRNVLINVVAVLAADLAVFVSMSRVDGSLDQLREATSRVRT